MIKEDNYSGKVLRTNDKDVGIPQGTAISAIYSNIYMIKIDEYINDLVKENNGIYKRYSDDFIIVLPNIEKGKFSDIKSRIEGKIKEAELSIHPDKTQIMRFSKGLLTKIDSDEEIEIDYLGFVFNGNTVKMREKSVYKYYRTAYKLIKKGEIISKRKGYIGTNTRLTYKRKLYQNYHQLGERTDIKYKYKRRKYGTFISYANRCQKIFDMESPVTNNLMKKQIKNHKRKINKKVQKALHNLRKLQ